MLQDLLFFLLFSKLLSMNTINKKKKEEKVPRILIITPVASLRNSLASRLKMRNFVADTAGDAFQSLSILEKNEYDFAVIHSEIQDMGPFELAMLIKRPTMVAEQEIPPTIRCFILDEKIDPENPLDHPEGASHENVDAVVTKENNYLELFNAISKFHR